MPICIFTYIASSCLNCILKFCEISHIPRSSKQISSLLVWIFSPLSLQPQKHNIQSVYKYIANKTKTILTQKGYLLKEIISLLDLLSFLAFYSNLIKNKKQNSHHSFVWGHCVSSGKKNTHKFKNYS